MTTLDDFLRDHPLVEWVDLLLPDISGVPRGKRLNVPSLRTALKGGAFFTTTTYAIDTTGENVDASGLVWEEGDADRLLALDETTLRPIPWREGAAQIIGGLANLDGTPFYGDCRYVLRQVAKRFEALGLTPFAAIELEFHLVDRENGPDGLPQVPHSERLHRRGRSTEVYTHERMDDQEAFFALVERYCAAQDLHIKGSLCEFAPSQYEINLGHTSDMVLCADEALMFKRCVKAAARATGQRATFMAKPFADHAGNGLHVHLSLVDRDGRNWFGQHPDGERNLRTAVGGLQATMAEAMLVWAPNANSYRRLRPLSYAPTTPAWGWNNRTVAIRIPPGGDAARRVEHRVAGSDANPHLVLAAVLAGVLHGIEAKAEASEPVIGNAYTDTESPLPLSWREAIVAHRSAERLPALMDPRHWRLYGAVRGAECDRFQAQLSPLEVEWYLTAV